MKKQHQYILAGTLLALLLFGVLAKTVISERLEDFRTVVELQQAEQRALLISLAETTARNGADTVTESVIRDCSTVDRDRFDILLSQLNNSLSLGELNELERLFGRCGSFYAERKTLMVSRMAREFAVYKGYTTQLEALTGDSHLEAAQIPEWEALIAYEQSQSQLFSNLVELQDQIINTLLAGKSSQSDEIKAILGEVREIQENLQLANTQAASMRSEIISL